MKNPFHKMMFLLATVAVIFSTLSLLNYREEDLIQPNENQIQNFFKKPIKKESEEVFEPLSSLYKDNKIHHADSMLQEENIIYYIQENTILRFDEETLEFQSYALSSFYPVEMQIYQHQLIVFGVTSNEKIIEIDQDKSFPYADYEFQIVFLEKKNLKKIRQIHFYHCYYIESQIMNGKMYFSLGTTDIVNKETQEFIYPRYKDSFYPLEQKLSSDQIFMMQDGQPVMSMTLLCKLNLDFLFSNVTMIGLLGIDGMIQITLSYVIVSCSSYQKIMYTHFLFFSLRQFSYEGKVTLKGYLMNVEAMNVYEDYFRVLLSYYEEEGAFHQVYNVRISDFQVLSTKEVAPLENIYCMRYKDNFLYISAFQYIDPLYVLDFSNPMKIQTIFKKETQWVQEYIEIHDNFIFTVGRKIDQDLMPKETVFSILHPETLDVLNSYTLDENISLQVIWDERSVIQKDNEWFFLGFIEQKSFIFRIKITTSIEYLTPILLYENWLQRATFGQKYFIAFGYEGLYLYHIDDFSLAKTFTYQRKDENR